MHLNLWMPGNHDPPANPLAQDEASQKAHSHNVIELAFNRSTRLTHEVSDTQSPYEDEYSRVTSNYDDGNLKQRGHINGNGQSDGVGLCKNFRTLGAGRFGYAQYRATEGEIHACGASGGQLDDGSQHDFGSQEINMWMAWAFMGGRAVYGGQNDINHGVDGAMDAAMDTVIE